MECRKDRLERVPGPRHLLDNMQRVPRKKRAYIKEREADMQ